MRDAILIGVALAALVLLLYLRDCKIAAIAVATIPVTVAIVLLGLGLAGQTINLMTLGGIAAAIGLVADDAIVVVENIARHAEERVSDDPVALGARRGPAGPDRLEPLDDRDLLARSRCSPASRARSSGRSR